MRARVSVVLTSFLATLLAVTLAPPATSAPPGDPEPRRDAETQARDSAADVRVPDVTTGNAAQRIRDLAYPRQQELALPEVNPADAAIKLGLVPYHGIAPKLNELQAASNRVSVEVIGQSAGGRDLYLVTVTSPESVGQALIQQRLRDRISERPAIAAKDPSIRRLYKAPLFFNGNIHGNEFEGADANLRVIEDLALSTDPAVQSLLDSMRLYFVVSMNPDGRIANTRANGNGFDMNRDFITATQPEVKAVRQVMIDTQALVMLDLHGYVNGTLIEPTTPPHGENYEYDLFIRHAYPNGLGMEAAVNGLGYTEVDDGVVPVQIPFRDFPESWDDWPPIFTPQYAAFHGSVSHTIEIPLRVNGASYNTLPVEELQRRSAINTDVAEATILASIEYVRTNRDAMLADQIEIFRRGAAGEPQREVPLDYFGDGTVGPEDIYTTDFPRAYVIPVGEGQRSAPAAARLVDHLVANDVAVVKTRRDFSAGGVTYPPGSYVVDMNQPKRGLANVILADGLDISDRVDEMYDISAWSLGRLWGATVGVVEDAGRLPSSRAVVAADPTGAVTGSGDLALQIDDPKDVLALDALLDAGVAVTWTNDGAVTVPASSSGLAAGVADQYGVVFSPASSTAGPVLESLVVAAAAPADELFALREMGFDVRPVSTAILNAGYDWSEVDTLFVSSGLTYSSLNPAAVSAVQAFLTGGGGVVARGGGGATFNAQAGLLSATRVAGRGDANGVVNVDIAGGPISADATPQTFVSSPSWFTTLGPEVAVEVSYSSTDVLLSGHWRPNATTGLGGQDAAAGQAVVIRGIDESGAGVVMFGSEPLYRAHPKGQYAQVARALYWATNAG